MPAINPVKVLTSPWRVDHLHRLWQHITTHSTATPISASTEYIGVLSSNISNLLEQAVCKDSNLELDWLWYAKQMQTPSEQRYCLYRAQQINPHTEAI